MAKVKKNEINNKVYRSNNYAMIIKGNITVVPNYWMLKSVIKIQAEVTKAGIFRVFIGALQGLRKFLAMMKNPFYFTLNLFSFSRYLNFRLDFLMM